MTVRTILDTKGHQIESVEPEAKLATAIKILSERKIGAVLVMSNGHIEGILSERDIVRVLGERGAAVLEEPVRAVMTRKVVGLISIGDIVKWRVMEFEAEQEALRDYIKTA